jgi:hypothetical protein
MLQKPVLQKLQDHPPTPTVTIKRSHYVPPALEQHGSWSAITGLSICFNCGPSLRDLQDIQDKKESQ